MGRCAVQVIIKFFHVFAVITLVTREAEISFLDHRVFFIPERNRETNKLLFITNTGNAFFTPAKCLASGHIMTYEFPGSSTGTVVFAYGTPLTIRNIGSPFFPEWKI